MKQQDSQPGEQSQPKLGPGDKLQTARISIGLTLEEVASKMHLSTAILTSLEENNFEDITAPIFVKGYLRAYSRLVNINEEDIIQQYSTYYMGGDPPISSTSNTSPEINADDSRIKWITYLVILALIVLLSTWWWNRYQQSPEMVSLESDNNSQTESVAFGESTEKTEEISNSMKTTAADSEQDSLQLEIKTVVDSLELKPQTEPLNVQTQEENKETISTVMQNKPEPVPLVTSTIEETDGELAKLEEQVSEEPDSDISTIPSSDKDLVITVNADTWASIKDATGKKLVYDLLKTGEQITVTGTAPYKAFLGNGYGVSIKYKGENIDLSRVIQPDNTARIKIGQ